MLNRTEINAKEPSVSNMEDFGRFSLEKTLDPDPEITGDSFEDESYAEENAGA